MTNKKTKLTLSGIAKKSIENIELAKTQSKNTVVIQKKKQVGLVVKVHLIDLLTKVTNNKRNLFFLQNLQDFLNLRLQLIIILKNVNLLNKEPLEELKVNYQIKIQKQN